MSDKDYICWRLRQRPSAFLERCREHRERTRKLEQEIKDTLGLTMTGLTLGYFLAAAIM